MIRFEFNNSELRKQVTELYGRDLFEFMNHAIGDFNDKPRKDNFWAIKIYINDVYIEENEEYPLNLYLTFSISIFNLKYGNEKYGTKYIWTNTRAKDFSCQSHSFDKVGEQLKQSSFAVKL